MKDKRMLAFFSYIFVEVYEFSAFSCNFV